jgi:hypothetical protein
MQIAALILSVVAIVVAGMSAKFTRDQARSVEVQAEAAKEQLRIIAEEWHEQRRPQFHARYHRTGYQTEAIAFTNAGPVDLSEISIEIDSGGYRLIDRLAGNTKVEHNGPWPIGKTDSFAFTRAKREGGVVVFRFTCIGATGSEIWVVPVRCELDRQPSVVA